MPADLLPAKALTRARERRQMSIPEQPIHLAGVKHAELGGQAQDLLPGFVMSTGFATLESAESGADLYCVYPGGFRMSDSHEMA